MIRYPAVVQPCLISVIDSSRYDYAVKCSIVLDKALSF